MKREIISLFLFNRRVKSVCRVATSNRFVREKSRNFSCFLSLPCSHTQQSPLLRMRQHKMFAFGGPVSNPQADQSAVTHRRKSGWGRSAKRRQGSVPIGFSGNLFSKNTARFRSGVVVSEGWGLIKLRHAQIGIPTRRDGISSIEDGFLLLL